MISKHTTTPGSLTSLTMAAILEFFISGRISMNFGMIGLDQHLKHMGSFKVVLNENLIGTRLTSLTMAAILEIFIYGSIWLKICMLSLDELPSHIDVCYVVYCDNFLVDEVNLLDNSRHFENLHLWIDLDEHLYVESR